MKFNLFKKKASVNLAVGWYPDEGLPSPYTTTYHGDLAATKARKLEMSNPTVNRYKMLLQHNVVGDGFMLKSAKAFSNLFLVWAGPKWPAFQREVIWNLARDGEAFILVSQDGPKLLDALKCKRTPNADLTGRVSGLIEGIRFDAQGNPVSYHFDNRTYSAQDIIHIFVKNTPDQVRGESWLAPCLNTLSSMDDLSGQVINHTRSASNLRGFIKSPDDSSFMTPVFGDTSTEEGVEAARKMISKLQGAKNPGLVFLPPGSDFIATNPDLSATTIEPMFDTLLRLVAAGLGLSYAAITGDQTSANFSSLRFGRLDDVATYRQHQQTLKLAYDELLRKFRERISGGGTNRWSWSAPGFEYIEPVKEATANKMLLVLGLTSKTRLLNEQGIEYETVLDEIVKERELEEQKGLNTPEPAPDTEEESDE